MKRVFELQVNGRIHEIFAEPSRTLAEILREELGLTGLKISCNMGDCGSCTVLVDGKTVKSCLILASQVSGKEITTIEGLADGDKLHPLQVAFIEHFAVQCGYCTPGMILAAKALLDNNPNPTEEEVKNGLSGNLCRCTGYYKIVEAVLAAADKMRTQ
ncbi:(2Fe-2S)-binding protein [Chloroflexota bacterium]